MIRHIVALRFRTGTPVATKLALYRDLAGLSDHIDGILDFRHFDNVSVETPLVRGFDDVFWFDFRDVAVRDTYLDDPAHKAVGARIVAELDGGIDGVFVADVAL
ncbi:Dabb family protein [Paragemmobacter straminiformis]|uniref:Dabb family protein n=1 Tax=Paragemmobacter straminiformis TaxID=2045119 RepID=A0A842ID75_9RHOB|nr:Dabb family protein [Gemmobacter straminiformis]MBC2837323.1 Dabb family protein [Gemmobacter straminiformis]